MEPLVRFRGGEGESSRRARRSASATTVERTKTKISDGCGGRLGWSQWMAVVQKEGRGGWRALTCGWAYLAFSTQRVQCQLCLPIRRDDGWSCWSGGWSGCCALVFTQFPHRGRCVMLHKLWQPSVQLWHSHISASRSAVISQPVWLKGL
jgi:hypothetical protein